MMHHRISRFHAAREGFFRLLFLLLLFLSALLIIDLLPSADGVAQPAFSQSTPLVTPNCEETPVESMPTPFAIESVRIDPVSHGLDFRGSEPKILIYHTHTTEAYTATKTSSYVQTSAYRTADATRSVLAVGEALAQRLRIQYGFSVIHDTTNHEPPSLKTAYSRSEQTMRRYLEQYPSLILFIDIHRDTSCDTREYVIVEGNTTARLMCVVGQGTKYEDKPVFERNYALASALTGHLRQIETRLARDVRVKTGRYNQHVG